MASSFEESYPNIANWVKSHGWIELGQDEYSSSLVRALNEGAWFGKVGLTTGLWMKRLALWRWRLRSGSSKALEEKNVSCPILLGHNFPVHPRRIFRLLLPYCCHRASTHQLPALLFLSFAGNLEARPAGFEPATGGLEVRCSVP